mgnify:CR=1 FL=1
MLIADIVLIEVILPMAIERPKTKFADNINIYKAEIIATLRLDDKTKALELLNNYITTLDSYNLDNIKSDNSWESLRDYIIFEKTWAEKMIIKLNGM